MNKPRPYQHQERLHALSVFIRRRNGPRATDYVGTPAAYRADCRTHYRNLRDARKMLAYLMVAGVIDASLPRGTDRLTWNGRDWHFVACQYEPIEYRAAACRYISEAIEAYWNMPRDMGGYRDRVVAKAAECFGPRIADRWFP
jgi:hypothetical protein